MSKPSDLEVPEALRRAAEDNVDQLRTAYEQFMEMARQAQSIVTQTQGDAAQSARKVQETALKFTQDNVNKNFRMMSEIARARTFTEVLELQGKHAQEWMTTYSEQTQELGRLMSDVAQQAAGPGKSR